MLLSKVVHELTGWRDVVRARFAADHPPVLGWQVPYIGCGLNVGRHGPAWIRRQYERLGSPFTLYMGGRRITFAQEPEYQHHFYTADVDQVSFFAGLETFPGFRELIPLGLSGDEKSTPGIEVLRQFLPARVTGATGELDEGAAACLRERLASGRADLLDTLRATIIHMTALLLVGPRLAGDREFIAAECAFEDALVRLVGNPFDRHAVPQGLAARERAIAQIVLELQRRRAEDHSGDARDVIDVFRRYRDAHGATLPDGLMAMDIHGFMFATLANTPAGAAMCLLHVLADPALHRRVVAEQDACRREHGDAITGAALKAMPLLNACYLEALRLYAPAMHLRMTLEPLQLGRYHVPARSLIAFSPYLLHRDPAVYTDPDVFDPERFLAGPRGPGKSPSPSHYLPYGRGVHTCLGRNLARQEIVVSIARLLRDHDVALEPVADPLAITWATNGIAAPAGPRTLLARPRA